MSLSLSHTHSLDNSIALQSANCHPLNLSHRKSSVVFGTLPSPITVTSTASLLALVDIVVQISEQPSSSSLSARGYEKLLISANDGAGGDSVWIWTLVSRSNSTAGAAAAITGIAVAVSDAQRAAADAAGYLQLPGDLNSGTGGSLVTLHVIRSSGNVAAGTQNSIDTALATPALYGLILARDMPANSTLVPGNINQGVVGAAPLYLYAASAPYDSTSVAVTWRPCECAVGTHFICLAGIAASVSNASAAPSYTAPLCVRIAVLPRLAPNWTTPSPKTRQFFSALGLLFKLCFLNFDSYCVYRPSCIDSSHACAGRSISLASHNDFFIESSKHSIHSLTNCIIVKQCVFASSVRFPRCFPPFYVLMQVTQSYPGTRMPARGTFFSRVFGVPCLPFPPRSTFVVCGCLKRLYCQFHDRQSDLCF